MANLKINTDSVSTAASKVKNYNDKIKEDFSNVRNAITALDRAWDSPAASAAISDFNALDSKYSQRRYNVVNDYVNFLYQQINVGYETTEKTNKSLADAFK